jgi:hypothetical protein
MLFSALRLLVTNRRLLLVQALPALLIWAVTLDLREHLLYGREFTIIRGPVVLVLFALAVLVTTGAFVLNAAFAFTICQPGGTADLRAGFAQARGHARAVTGCGAVIGLALGVAAILVPRWGLHWFALSLGIVLAVLLVCYVAVPARLAGARTVKRADMSWHRDKLAATAVAGLAGAIICTPPYVISRVGEGLLGSHPLFALGVALIVIGLALEAGATGAVKAIKVSAGCPRTPPRLRRLLDQVQPGTSLIGTHLKAADDVTALIIGMAGFAAASALGGAATGFAMLPAGCQPSRLDPRMRPLRHRRPTRVAGFDPAESPCAGPTRTAPPRSGSGPATAGDDTNRLPKYSLIRRRWSAWWREA